MFFTFHNLLKLGCSLWYNVNSCKFFLEGKERGLINNTSNKQETIKRMILRQYDQLLEECKQTKLELEYLSENSLGSDLVYQLEIEKTHELVFLIEHEIKLKKQELYDLEIKNRYQQLLELYQKTQAEVGLLESTLRADMQQDAAVQDEEIIQDVIQDENPNWFQMDDEFLRVTSQENLKRGRLNLSTPTDPQQALIEKWEESLSKIEELEEQQQLISESIPSEELEVPKETEEIEVLVEKQEPQPQLEVVLAESEEQEQAQENESEFVVHEERSSGFRLIGGILNLMFYLVLIGSILFIALFGIYRADSGQPPTIAGFSIMRVATGSMYPTLPVNTLILTRYVDPMELEINDIVTFSADNEITITHRIYTIYEDYQGSGILGFRLIGDANNGIPDDEVHLADYLHGRYVASSYHLGRFLMFFHYNIFMIMAVTFIVLIVLFILKRPFGRKRLT